MITSLFSNTFRLLAFGIFFLGFGIYELLPVFTTSSDLVPLRGLLEKSEVKYFPIRSRHKSSGYTPTLFFTLKGDDHIFRLTDESDLSFMGQEYDNLLRIKDSAMVCTVYIDKEDIDEVYPKVFQIDCDDETILEFEVVRKSRVWLAISLMTFGTAFLLVYFYQVR